MGYGWSVSGLALRSRLRSRPEELALALLSSVLIGFREAAHIGLWAPPEPRRTAPGNHPDPGGTACKELGMGYRSRRPSAIGLVLKPFSMQA